MENIEYTPKDSVLLNNVFGNYGWGASSCGLLGLLLMALFNPNSTVIGQHPFPNINDEDLLNKLENASTEDEKRELIESSLDDYWKKAFDKIKNPDPEAEQRLEEDLKEINNKIEELSKQKQSIIDDWVME